MSGRNQHIIPKLLLKGFASSEKKGNVYTWWFRRGQAFQETNIQKINVEGYFYGKDREDGVDAAITKLEGKFGVLIDTLRELPNHTDISDSEIAEFIAHLSARSRHLRQTFIESTELLLTELESYYGQPSTGRSFVRRHFQKHPEILSKKIEEVIATYPGSRNERRLVAKGLRRLPKATLLAKIERDFPDFFSTQVSEQLAAFKQRLPSITKEHHLKTLAMSLVPEVRVESYKKLHWTIREASIPLVLADVGCLFVVDGYTKWISLAGKDEIIRFAFLPISTTKLVVGSLDDCPNVLDFAHINSQMLSRSRDFFVTGIKNEYTETLYDLLGTDAQLLTDEEIQRIVEEVGEDS
jgi:hypothetical protein